MVCVVVWWSGTGNVVTWNKVNKPLVMETGIFRVMTISSSVF